MDIFIARQGQTLGPLDLPTINSKLRSGEFTATDLCWSEGAPDWKPLSTMDGVVIPAPSQVPPPLHTATGGYPPPPPTHFPAPSPTPTPYPAPYGAQTDGAYGGAAGAENSDIERTLFDVSASPVALSMKEIVLGLLCTGGIWCVYVVAVNLTTRYKLTNQRLTLRSGLVSQKVEEVEIYRIRDVSMEQEVIGRLLNFGDVIVHSSDASSPKIVLRHVHSPNKIKEQIRTASRQGRRSEGIRTNEFMG